MDDLSSLVPGASDDGLDSLVVGSKTNNVNALRGSQFVADPIQPDQMGEAIHLANEFQTDPWFVHDNLQNFKAQKPSFNIPRLVDEAPGVTKFFFKPENAALGKDDLDPLSRIDRGTQIVSKSYLKDLGEAASSGFNDARKSMISFAVSHGQITPEQAAKQISEIQAEESKLQPPKYLDEMNKSFHEAGKNIEVAANKYSEAIKNYQDGQILESLKNFGSGAGTSIGALLDYAKTAVTHLRGVGYITAQGLSSYAPVLAAGELGGVTGALAGGPFAPVTGALGGMGGLFLSGKLLFSGQRFNQKLLERGIDPNDKDALLKAYSDPQLMADIRKDSDSYGTTFSVLNSLFGGLGGVFQKSGVSLAEGLAARAARSGAGVALQTGGQAISSMAAETAATGRPNTEEALQMAFSNLAPAIAHEVVGGIRKSKSVVENPDVIPPEPTQSDVIDIPPEDVVIRRKELLSKYPENPVEAVKDVAVDTHEAVQTLHDIQAMAEMGDAVKESKVAKRVPDKIDELVQSSGGKGFVYFQPSDWDQYFLNKGLSPAKAAAQVMQDDGVAYMRSKEAGTPIVIPLSTYISRLAPTEHYDALLNFVRTSPEGMNFVEAKTHMEQLPETMTALSEKAKAPISENEQIIQIKEDTKRQLIEAGVPEEQAARISEVNAAFYTTQAKNHGLDPLSLYKEQGIVFNGPGIEGQRLSQSDAPMPSKAFEKFGKSKEGLAGYIANPKSNLGRYINIDLAREQHPQYPQNRAKYIRLTDKGAQRIVEQALAAARKAPVTGDGSYIFGGTGVGKTTAAFKALDRLGKISDYVYDFLGSNPKTFKEMIQKTLDEGRDANIVFVFTPYEKALANIIQREISEGRPVTADMAAVSHIKAFNTYIELAKEYKNQRDRVKLIAVTPDFSGVEKLPFVRDLSEIQNQGYIKPNETEAQAIERLTSQAKEAGLKTASELESGTGSDVAGPQSFGPNGRTLFQNGAQANVKGIAPDPLGYYSALSHEISKMDFQSIPAKDLLGRINNLPGIKQEELEWTGIKEFLQGKEGKVSKEEVQSFLDQHGVKIEQVVLGASEDGSNDMKWSAPEALSLDEIDPYGELVSSEADYYLNDEYWLFHEMEELDPEHYKDYGSEDNISLKTIPKEFHDQLTEAAVSSAEDYLSTNDHPWAQERISSDTHDIFIEGNDDMGWTIYSRLYGINAHIESGLEEAKIHAIRLLQQKGALPEEVRPTLQKDIQWGFTEAQWEDDTPEQKAWVEKNLDKFYEKRKKYYAKSSFYKNFPEKIPPDSKIRNEAKIEAAAKFQERFKDQSIQRNKFKVETENPFLRLSLEGSAKDGFDLTVKDNDSISTTIRAKNIEDAKQKAIEYLREKKIIVDQLPEGPKEINQPTGTAKYGAYTLNNGTNYREILLRLPNAPEAFTQSHFRESNVLAHIRTKDRSNPNNGKKILFIEEVQSDWHQKGREQGYNVATPDQIKSGEDAVFKAKNALQKSENTLRNKLVSANYLGFDSQNQALNSILQAQNIDAWIGQFSDLEKDSDLSNAIRNYYEAHNSKVESENALEKLVSGVPQAPFKNTEAWAALAFKRILSMAAQDGYDQIAWGPGSVHANRYNLKEYVDRLSYEKNGDDSYGLRLYDKSGDQLPLPQPSYTEKEMAELLGKNVAEKIVSGEGDTVAGSEKEKILETKDLEIGGEGHKYFYDKVLPKILSKHLQKINKGSRLEVRSAQDLFGTRGLTEKNNTYSQFWSLDVSPELKAAIEKGQTLFQKGDEGHRGQITIGPNQTFNIELFKSADASTPIHELGHAYLEILNNLYTQGGGSDQSKADFETIREWLGAKEGERFTTEQHEQFSRGFEAYMMEGKAPSNALRRAFQSFMKWLTNIYRSVLNLKVELSDNVRAVFDRMLASEEEIQSKIPEPLFREPTLEGMTPKQAESYTKLQSDLQEHSASILRESLMKDLERLKNPIYKEIEAKVEAQVNEDPGFNALSILQKGKLADGSELSEGMWPIKLSKESVKSDYGVDRIDRLPKGIYGADGLHPDIAANFLGFKSGEDLLGTLENLPDKKSLIKTITDETAKETYPNAFDEPQFSNEVLKAVYNEKLKDMLRMELEHLASENLPGLKGVIRNINRRPPTDLEVRAQAKGILADRALNNLRPIEFSRAADKARKEAGVLLTKGDIDGAFEAKRRELLNIELFRQAQAAQTNIRKGLQRFKKAARSDADLSVSRDLDFVNAARSLLASFGLGRPTEKSASEYLQSTESYNPDRFQDLQNLIDPLMKGSKNYTDLTYSEFLDLKQGFDALWHLAKEEKSILIDGKKMAIEEAKLKIKNQSDKLTNVKAPKRARKSIDNDARFKADFSKLSEYATLMESLMQRWDLENIDGPFQSLFFRPVNEAIENYRSAKEKTLSKLDQIYNDLFKNISGKDIYAPELDFTFRGKGHLLGALLHRGNLSNFSKFIRGYGFGFLDESGNLDQSKWDRFMDRMHKDGIITKSDYDHIQKIWDLFEELKPDAQKVHYQIRGYYFDEITHQPFKTPFGEYPGGYFPATADPFADTDLMSRKEKEDLKKQAASFAFPTTGSGFTKKRVEAYAAPLQLDPNYIKPALDWVLRFSHIEPKIADVRKLLSNREIRSLIKEINPNAIGEVVVPWLQRSGTQRLIDPSGNVVFDKAVKHIRQAAVLNFLGFDIINALQQQGGNLTALLKVPAKYLRDAHIEFLTSPLKTTQWISEQSEFMKNHSGDQLYKLEESTSDIVNNPTYFEKSGEIVQKASTFLTRISQHYVDQVTWLGAYNHSVATADKTKTLEQIHKQAVRAADSAVRLTQGSGFPEHVSKWATGSRAKSLLTIFSNYWVVMSNLYKQKSFIARAEQGPGAKEWARANARKLYAFGLTAILPTLFAAFMSSILRGKKKDRDDDGSVWDDYAMSFGTQMASASANIAAPGVGSQVYTLAQAIDHIVRDKGGPYAANIQISPVISSAEKSIQGGVSAARAIKQHKKLSGSQIQDVFTLLGLVTKIPAAPLARPFSYLRDVNEGNIKPAKNPVDLVRGLLTGTGEKRKLR